MKTMTFEVARHLSKSIVSQHQRITLALLVLYTLMLSVGWHRHALISHVYLVLLFTNFGGGMWRIFRFWNKQCE